MKNKYHNIVVLFIGVFLFVLITTIDFYACPFRMITGIPCPGCGLTTAFYKILQLKFLEAFYLNPLSIPLFLTFALIGFLIIFDLFFNTNHVDKIKTIKLSKSHILFFAVLGLINWIVKWLIL